MTEPELRLSIDVPATEAGSLLEPGLTDTILGDVRRTAMIIAIDELDKFESADDAQRFVNEIKGIFGALRLAVAPPAAGCPGTRSAPPAR